MKKAIRLIGIIFICFGANSFAAKSEALTFLYGGRETRLVSDNNVTIQTWASKDPYSSHLSDSGTVWHTVAAGGWGGMPACNGGAPWANIVELDWNGNTIRTITTEQLGGGTPHHAITLTDKGTVLAIVAENYNGRCGERLVEFDPKQNKVIWTWHTNDHEGTNDPRKLKRGFNENDPYHINSMDLDVRSNRIVFTSHEVFEAFIIDRGNDSNDVKGSAGDLLWRIGNPTNYGASGLQYATHAIHSAIWVKPEISGAGNIVFYSNQSPANSNYATAYEFTPIYSLNNVGEWQYNTVFTATNNSSKQSFSGGIDKIYNGNWIVTFSNENYTAYEFDATLGSVQTTGNAVGSWNSAGQNGGRRYPVCGGRLLAGVKANDQEAIALYNSAGCANSSSSSIESSSSDVISIGSPLAHNSDFDIKINSQQLYLSGLDPNSLVSVYDLQGSVKFNALVSTSEYQLNTTSWTSGVYMVNIVRPNKTAKRYKTILSH